MRTCSVNNKQNRANFCIPVIDFFFSVASTQLTIGCVRPLVRWSVRNAFGRRAETNNNCSVYELVLTSVVNFLLIPNLKKVFGKTCDKPNKSKPSWAITFTKYELRKYLGFQVHDCLYRNYSNAGIYPRRIIAGNDLDFEDEKIWREKETKKKQKGNNGQDSSHCKTRISFQE